MGQWLILNDWKIKCLHQVQNSCCVLHVVLLLHESTARPRFIQSTTVQQSNVVADWFVACVY